MTYTVQNIDSINQADFDILWEDCKTVIENETFPYAQKGHVKETVFTLINSLDVKFKVQKDGVDIAVLAGSKDNNKLSIAPALFGNDNSNSKSWLYDADYWSAIKAYTTSQSCLGYGGEVVKNSSAYNMLIAVHNNSLYDNSTLEETNTTTQGNIMTTTIWFNHN